jgi:RNA polymerase sigma-70 factor (ECF subfamily)
MFVAIEIPEARSFLEQAQAGDAEAFGELCRAYETRLLRQAVALCGDVALAEDLAQDTFIAAWKSVRRYNGKCQFFTWLCAILLHRHHNVHRRRRPSPLSALAGHDRDELQDRIDNVAGSDDPPDQAAQRRERAAQVQACIQALPPKHQQVIYLRFYVDDSLEGIAAALGCSVGTVKSRLFYALDKLRCMDAFRERGRDLQIGVDEL